MVFVTRDCEGIAAGCTLIVAEPLPERSNRFEMNLTTHSTLEPDGVCCKSAARISARRAWRSIITRGCLLSASDAWTTNNSVKDRVADARFAVTQRFNQIPGRLYRVSSANAVHPNRRVLLRIGLRFGSRKIDNDHSQDSTRRAGTNRVR